MAWLRKTKLYIELYQIFNTILVECGVYIIPIFGYHFGIQETTTEINLIYKGRVLRTYPNTAEGIFTVTKILYDCVFIRCDTLKGTHMFAYEMVDNNTFTHNMVWKTSHPFSSGDLIIGIYHTDCVEFIDHPLTAAEVSEEIFKIYPELILIHFGYKNQHFIYINKNALPATV